MSKINNEKALEWVESRIHFIKENCNLKYDYNKEVYEMLTYIKEVLKGVDQYDR